MKKLSIILVLAVLVSGLSFTSCGKYEEGPAISLLPKKSRLQNKWKAVERVDASGVVTTVSDDGSYMEFVKGGTVKTYDGTFDVGLEGTWEFSDDKTELIMSFEVFGVTSTQTLKIVKLKINSLGLEDEDGDKTYYEYF